MNTSRQLCQPDSCNRRPTDFLPYRRGSEEKTKNKRGAPTPTPLSTPLKETDDNPRYFQFLSQAQKNLFPNYSPITKATLASTDNIELVRPYLTLIQNIEMATAEKTHNQKDHKKKREKITVLQKEIAQFTNEHIRKESQGQGLTNCIIRNIKTPSTKIYSFVGALAKVFETMGPIVPITSERSPAFPKKSKG